MFPELLRRCADLTDGQIAVLESHYQLLLRWNSRLNLTTVTGIEQAVDRHYCESLFVARHLPPGPLRIADIGSGAGFPGIPVAVLRPDCSISLIESHKRKAVFLREATRDLPNIQILAARAEAIAGHFEWAISRAVSYDDLRKPLRRIAPNAALLTGADLPPADLGFIWEAGIALPGARGRFLRLGHLHP